MTSYFTIVCKDASAEHVLFDHRYESGQAAKEYADLLNSNAKRNCQTQRYMVRKMTDEMNAWREREQSRFDTNYYGNVPWINTMWWSNSKYRNTHFPHTSTTDPTMVAFTPSEEAGLYDRKRKMKPGRYLQKYFSDCISSEHIKMWIDRFNALHEKHEVLFASTADQIEHVYTNGPHSCMAYKTEDFDGRPPFHPTRVYAAGDLQVAYILRDNRITARCVVWPEKKRASRMYGDDVRLSRALSDLGFTWDEDFFGARLLRHKVHGGFVAPYLDPPNEGVTDNGEFLIIDDNYEIECRNTSGTTHDGYVCDRCGENMHENDLTIITDINQRWCEHCTDNYSFRCDNCSEYQSDDMTYEDNNGENICGSCANNYYTKCGICNVYYRNGTNFITTPDDTEVCKSCQDELEPTPCGQLAVSKDDCDCATCKTSRTQEENAPQLL